MQMTGYMIVGMEDQIEPVEALREVIENAEKENAEHIILEITSTSFSVTDDGKGCDDPNVMVTPGISRSRYDDTGTGSKGYGLKEAAACFGRTWEVHTVTRAGTRDIGKYRHHKITWDPEGPLPFKYDGEGKPAETAPRELRMGGTKLVVTDRKEGFPRLTLSRMESWCKTLEKSYRPALDRLTITLRNPEIGFKYKLRNTALDANKFIDNVREQSLRIAGRTVIIRFGVLKDADEVLSGCHYICGPRVLEDSFRINGLSLPLRCFVDVILPLKDWKLLLSTNKERVRYRDDIDDAITAALKDWIEQQDKQVMSYEIRVQLGRAASPVHKVIAMLNEDKQGNWETKQREKKKTTLPKDKDKDKDVDAPVKPRQFHTRRKQATPGAGFGVKKDDRTHRCLSLDVRADDIGLGTRLYRASIVASESVAIIWINTNPNYHPDMKTLFQRGYVTQIIALAYADAASLEPTTFGPLFLSIKARDSRYEMLDESTPPDQIRSMVGNFFLTELAKQKPKLVWQQKTATG